MKSIQVVSAAALVALATAIPTDYTPQGGWESVKYPAGTGENLHKYPAPPGGWEKVNYPPGTGANLHEYTGGWGSVDYNMKDNGGKKWTSTFHIKAIGSEVRNGTTSTPGPDCAVGYFDFQINSKKDKICYQITLLNVEGTYKSPAKTATHIHEAVRGASGPPRLAFANPVGDDKKRYSEGCMTGPFTTGFVGSNAQDTGIGFKVAQIEANPAGFFCDSHTTLFPAGVVRGQLA